MNNMRERERGKRVVDLGYEVCVVDVDHKDG